MNLEQQRSLASGIKPHHSPQIASTVYDGIYHSNSVNKPPFEVYSFFQNEAHIKRVLSDLPDKMESFLDLKLVNTVALNEGHYRIEWKNNEAAKIQGTLAFILSPGHAGKGTNVIANAVFADYKMDNEDPSDLINFFLKRMKSLAETGQLATIKGQPNGKDEEEIKKSQALQH